MNATRHTSASNSHAREKRIHLKQAEHWKHTTVCLSRYLDAVHATY